MATPRVYVPAPPATPLPFGLYSAAVVQEASDPHEAFGVQWEPDACEGVATTIGACLPDSPENKTATDGVPLVVTDPITLYHLHQCRPVGRNDLLERARAAMRLGEQRAVEAAFMAQLAADPDTVLVSSDVVSPAVGLGMLEQYAASIYGAVPVIHVSRLVGAIITQRGGVSRQGTQLQTVQGSVVASGGGYADALGPDETTPTEGTGYMYVTGQVMVRRGSVDEVETFMDLHSPINTASALVERTVNVGYECFAAAVAVSLSDTGVIDGGGA